LNPVFHAAFCDELAESPDEAHRGSVTTRVPSKRTVKLCAHSVHSQNVSIRGRGGFRASLAQSGFGLQSTMNTLPSWKNRKRLVQPEFAHWDSILTSR
jgi:hypothetical protein